MERSKGREEHQEYLNNKRSSSTSKIEFDILNQAEQDFTRKKLRNPEYFRNQVLKESEGQLQSACSRAKSSNYLSDNSLNYKSGIRNIILTQISDSSKELAMISSTTFDLDIFMLSFYELLLLFEKYSHVHENNSGTITSRLSRSI